MGDQSESTAKAETSESEKSEPGTTDPGGSDESDKPAKASRFRRKPPSDSQVVPGGEGPKAKGSKFDLTHLRIQVARLVGLVFLVLALILAAAALCIALEANPDNSFVSFVLDAAKAVDLGVFDLENPIKEFGGANGPTKEALLNYGLGAVVYLVVGRLLERVIRP